MDVAKGVSRVKYGGVCNVKGGSIELLEYDLCHALSVSWSVPRGFCDKDWVVCGGDAHDVFQRVTDKGSYRVEVLN